MGFKSQMTFSQIQNYINDEQNNNKEFILHVDLSTDDQVEEKGCDSDD